MRIQSYLLAHRSHALLEEVLVLCCCFDDDHDTYNVVRACRFDSTSLRDLKKGKKFKTASRYASDDEDDLEDEEEDEDEDDDGFIVNDDEMEDEDDEEEEESQGSDHSDGEKVPKKAKSSRKSKMVRFLNKCCFAFIIHIHTCVLQPVCVHEGG